MSIDDHLTPAELRHIELLRQQDAHRAKQRAAVATLSRGPEAPDPLPAAAPVVPTPEPSFATLLFRMLAEIEGRPDINPIDLEAFGNRCNRLAWKTERDRTE